MRIDFDSIDRNDFRVSERFIDGIGSVVLINPSFTKHIWKDEDKHLRSLLCDSAGKVLSSGFFKFKNLYETQQELTELSSAFNSGRLYLTEKLDGSLIIISVVNGRVLIRTRGSHEVEPEMRSVLLSFIQKNHPKLLDPAYLDPDGSFLFEWTSRSNMIVIPYQEEKLTLIGHMSHVDDSPEMFLYGTSDLLTDSDRLNIPSVKFWQPSESSLDEMIQNISQDQNREGCVAFCYQDHFTSSRPYANPYLVKLKTKWYLELHRAAYTGTTESRNLIAKFAARSPEELTEKMLTVGGVDFEIASLITEKCRHIFEETSKDYQRLMESSEEMAIKLAGILDRKTAALTIKDYLSSKNLPGGWLGMLLSKHFGKESDWDLAQRSVLSGLSSTYIKQNILNS